MCSILCTILVVSVQYYFLLSSSLCPPLAFPVMSSLLHNDPHLFSPSLFLILDPHFVAHRCFHQAAQENHKVICCPPPEKAHLSSAWVYVGELYMHPKVIHLCAL